jgi:outer membrane protein TolC
VEARVKTVLDRSRCDGELARAKAAESRLAAERRVQLARFCHKTGIACSEGLMLSGELDGSSDVRIDRAAVRREAVAGRPELASAAARSRIAAVAAVEARRERLPWVSFVQVTRLSPGSRWGVNVGVDLGLFGWRSGEVRAAEAEAARARLMERSVRRAISAEVDELLLRLENVSRLLFEAEEEAAVLAGQFEFVTVQLGSGECDRTEPLGAKIRVLDARRERVSLLMEYWALEAGLRQATGRAGL